MEPVSPVFKGAEACEITVAKDQPEYFPLPAILGNDGRVTSRWRLTDFERLAIAAGADIMHTVLSGGKVYPVMLYIADPDYPLADPYIAIVNREAPCKSNE